MNSIQEERGSINTHELYKPGVVKYNLTKYNLGLTGPSQKVLQGHFMAALRLVHNVNVILRLACSIGITLVNPAPRI